MRSLILAAVFTLTVMAQFAPAQDKSDLEE